jgi:hypothetical protein
MCVGERNGSPPHAKLAILSKSSPLLENDVNQLKTLALLTIVAPAILLGENALAAVEGPKETCSNIKWNPAFLEAYPKAPVTCREVTVKDGIKYAKFNGKVSKVSHQSVQVEVSDVGDIPVSTIAFEVGVGGRITMGDKTEKVKDLRVGDQLTFWVREGEFGVSPTLADKPIAIIKPEAMPTS